MTCCSERVEMATDVMWQHGAVSVAGVILVDSRDLLHFDMIRSLLISGVSTLMDTVHMLQDRS